MPSSLREAHLSNLLRSANERIAELEAEKARALWPVRDQGATSEAQRPADANVEQALPSWDELHARATALVDATIDRRANERQAILEGAENIGVGLFPAEPE